MPGCPRTRLYVLLLAFLALFAPVAPIAADTDDDARWKNGELVAPLPADPVRRAAAVERAVALGAARVRPTPAKSVTYGPNSGQVVVYPTHVTAPQGQSIPDADPAVAAWLDDLRERLRRSEQSLAYGAKGAVAADAAESSPALAVAPASVAAAIPTTFDGIDDTGLDPGSPDIAVGPNQMLLVTTDRFSIMEKCGTTLLTSLFRTFFSLPATRSYYTPKVIYDSWTPRWIMLYIGTPTDFSTSSLYLAVSHTANPLGAWTYYNIDVVFLAGLKDAPSIAVTPNEIYITYNQFNLTTFNFERVVMLELIKSQVYGLGAVALNYHAGMTNPHDASLAISIQPAQMRTYGGDMYFVNSVPFGADFMTLWKLTGSPGASVLTGYDVSVGAYTAPADMVQPDLTLVEAGDCRIRDAVYASGKLYAAYTRNSAGPTVELRRIDVATLFDDGFFIGGGDDYAYPSIDIDENDQVTLAYCTTGPARFPSIGFNILAFPGGNVTSGTIAPGLANFSSGASPARWGHYTGVDLDPLDGRTLWVHGCYASDSPLNSWTTKVGAVTAFPTSIFVANTASSVFVAGPEGGPFAPEQILFQLQNDGGTTLRWLASGVPSWLTAEAGAGSLAAGTIELIGFNVDADANLLPPGVYDATIRFENCLGPESYDFDVQLAIGVDGSCPGARLHLTPPTPPFAEFYDAGPIETGAFVTAIEDVTLCAIGILAAIDTPQLITVTVYGANGNVRLAPIATNSAAVVGYAGQVRYVPIDVTLEACKDYDIAVEFGNGAAWVYWDDTEPGAMPADVGGLVRVRDAESAGNSVAIELPRISLVTDSDPCTNLTDLDAGAGAGVELTTGTAQSLYVEPKRTVRMCSLGLRADLAPGTHVTTRVYQVGGVLRLALLAEGSTVVTSPLFTFHDVPISQVLSAGSQYEFEFRFENSGAWGSFTTPPAVIPYTVDNTMLVYGGGSDGFVSSTLPHLRVGWSDLSVGTAFDLAKIGAVYPAPSTSTGSLSHGAYLTSLVGQELYGAGVMADVPDGGSVSAFLYEATGTTRGPLISTGVVTSNGGGMRWHDIPLAASLLPDGEYDLMFTSTPTSWPYWTDTSGLPYDSYGVIRVRDAESGGTVGTSFLAHMRVHACNSVLTAVGDGPARAPMWLDPPAPNPATGTVRFRYSVDVPEDVEVAVYDVRGRRVGEIARPARGTGRGQVEFDTRALASGVYFVKLTTPTKSTSRKFVVAH